MELFELPLELITAIFEQTVETLGLQRSLRSRLVCKRFSAELARALSISDVVVQFAYGTRSYPTTFLVQYLKHRSSSNAPNAHPLFELISRRADFLLARGKLKNRADCLDAVCMCLVHYLGAQGVANMATQRAEKFVSELKDNNEKHDQLALAAWTGDLDYVQATVNAEWRTHEYSTYYFGSSTGAAAFKNRDRVVQFLLKSRHLGHITLDTSEALRRASEAGRGEIAKMILDDDQDIGIDIRDFQLAIFEAAEYGHCELLQDLMSDSRFYADETDLFIVTQLLSRACEGGHIQLVRDLLSSIKLSDAKFRDQDADLVYYASYRGHADVLELLLPVVSMYYPKWCTSEKEDTLAQTARRGHIPVIRLLLQHEFPVDGIRSSDGYSTPLCRAVEHGQYAAAALLLDRGASVKGRIGAHIMTRAIESGEFSMVRLLAERGCDVNQGFYDDKPPIVVAAREKQWAIEALLVELGAVRPTEPLPPDTKVYSTICA